MFLKFVVFSLMKYLCAKKSKSFTECEKVIGGYIERTWGSPTVRVVKIGRLVFVFDPF